MDRDLRTIISRMTLEEKIGMCSGLDHWHLKSIERLGVPTVRVCDGPSGLRFQTGEDDHLGVHASEEMISFPTGCAMASSFDRALMHKLGEALGEECHSVDVSVILGPAANIKRSPLCGRNFEYLSEDPYLAGEMAAAQIQGIQRQNIGACMKHFACNNQESWRMSVSAEADERTLREIYLTPFEIAVKTAQPKTLMCSYNRINGVYAGEDRWLLTDVLRNEWGFEGYVLSDWGAVNDRVLALKAGLDLEMPGCDGITDRQLLQAVEAGELDESVIDTAVERILRVLFSYADHHAQASFDKAAHHQLAIELETECAVLLQNANQFLPLAASQKVVFVGEYAKHPRIQGGGSAEVTPCMLSAAVDAAQGLPLVSYVPGFPADSDVANETWHAQAVQAAKSADVAVIFGGLPDAYESECYDRVHMRLPNCQDKLIADICAVQANVVVVLHNGAPIEMPWISQVKAVLEMYTGGQGVGQACVDLLYGKANPSGKLAETFPVRLEDNPSYLYFPGDTLRAEYREGIFVGYRYYEKKNMGVLFPFGHGLSYTTFAYANLRMDKQALREGENLTVTVDITNTGNRAGKEVVQLYVADHTQATSRPLKELKGFEKISLEPGECQSVSFVLDRRSFAWYSLDQQDWCCASGEYEVLIGASTSDIRCAARIVLQSAYKPRLSVTLNTLMSEIAAYPALWSVTERMLRAASPKIEEILSGTDDNARYLANELYELPFHAIRGLYNARQEDLEAIVQCLGEMSQAGDRV